MGKVKANALAQYPRLETVSSSFSGDSFKEKMKRPISALAAFRVKAALLTYQTEEGVL